MVGPYRTGRRQFLGARLLAARFFVAVTLLVAASTATAVVPPISQPVWVELSLQQQQILAPLAGEWDQLEFWRRKKWLDISARYPRLTPEEQARVQAQMKAWVKLTPDERKAAREKYKNVQRATPEQREALKKMWTEYQALPPEEKQRLQESAASKAQPKSPTARARLAPRPAAPAAPTAIAPPSAAAMDAPASPGDAPASPPAASTPTVAPAQP